MHTLHAVLIETTKILCGQLNVRCTLRIVHCDSSYSQLHAFTAFTAMVVQEHITCMFLAKTIYVLMCIICIA